MSTPETAPAPARALDLRSPDDYRAERLHIYPSTDSLRWFIRRNRDELVRCGALTCPTGRWMVQPEAFDRAIVAIGQKRAAAAAHG